jgi:DNA-binding transcriptional MerR regulator
MKSPPRSASKSSAAQVQASDGARREPRRELTEFRSGPGSAVFPGPSEWTISEVAERTGVPIATIKFYIREGLLPRPRTAGRTVGRYDAAFVHRLELVRELRNRFRLSLREIMTLLAESAPSPTLTELELRLMSRERLDGAIDPTHSQPPVAAARLIERSGLPPEDVAELIKCGLLTPIKVDGAVVYAERDARIAEVVGALRSSGYNHHLGFAISDLSRYALALRSLVVREVEQFDNPALRDLPRDEMLKLIGQGVAHIDVLLGLLHKKLLLAAVHDRLDAAVQSRGKPEPARPPARPRPPSPAASKRSTAPRRHKNSKRGDF